MIYQTVKTTADLPFTGVELVKVDKNITEVIIGGKLRIKAGTYSGLEVLVAKPLETGSRHRVTATIEGFDPKVTYFEHDFDAKSAVAEFEQKGAEAKAEKVDVLIDEAGAVVSDAANVTATVAADEMIPF